MKSPVEKPYLLLGDKPVLAHTLLALERSPDIQEIVLVVRRSRIVRARKLVRHFNLRKVTQIREGGATRFESVFRGLRAVSPETDLVLVHDGARPLLSADLIRRVRRSAHRYGAAIPVIPVSPTIKRGKGGFVTGTLDRKELWDVQTPQGFRYPLFLKACYSAKKKKRDMTDCASVVEEFGKKVRLVPGDRRNIKITTPEELQFAAFLLKRKQIQ